MQKEKRFTNQALLLFHQCRSSRCRHLHPSDLRVMNHSAAADHLWHGRDDVRAALRTAAFLAAVKRGAQFVFHANPGGLHVDSFKVQYYFLIFFRQVTALALPGLEPPQFPPSKETILFPLRNHLKQNVLFLFFRGLLLPRRVRPRVPHRAGEAAQEDDAGNLRRARQGQEERYSADRHAVSHFLKKYKKQYYFKQIPAWSAPAGSSTPTRTSAPTARPSPAEGRRKRRTTYTSTRSARSGRLRWKRYESP